MTVCENILSLSAMAANVAEEHVVECFLSYDELITSMRDREVLHNLKYNVRPATKAFGDSGRYAFCF